MKLSLQKKALNHYLKSQLNHFFPDGHSVNGIDQYLDEVLERMAYCFSAVANTYYWRDSQVYFNHLHGDHYATFLYFLANTLYRHQAQENLREKIFYLNKALHGLDVFYAVELPTIFQLVHPIGTVLGRAKYADYLVVSQGCTVGNNHGIYPTLGQHVVLYPGATVLGKCQVGDDCRIAAGALLVDQNLKPNTTYFGMPKNFVVTKNTQADTFWR